MTTLNKQELEQLRSAVRNYFSHASSIDILDSNQIVVSHLLRNHIESEMWAARKHYWSDISSNPHRLVNDPCHQNSDLCLSAGQSNSGWTNCLQQANWQQIFTGQKQFSCRFSRKKSVMFYGFMDFVDFPCMLQRVGASESRNLTVTTGAGSVITITDNSWNTYCGVLASPWIDLFDIMEFYLFREMCKWWTCHFWKLSMWIG